MENYILFLDFQEQKYFTKLRTSSHCLHIETGRYSRPTTPAEERLCQICKNGKVEDEEHFLMYCDLYADLRNQLFESLSEFSTFNFQCNHDTFCLLMNYSNGDCEFSREICKYITACFNIRQQTIDQ
jgi:hypothetical protein